MQFDDLITKYHKFGNKPGLDRVRWLLAQLQGARPAPDVLKITGSNGKGSVAAMSASILCALGRRVGCTTSPHLRRWNERFLLDGAPAPDAAIHAALGPLSAALARWEAAQPRDPFGSFELLTALAWRIFLDAGVEVVVAEAGIGGRCDATAALPGSLAALCSLDLEHTALLGGTLEEIAVDKADLCPPGGQLLVGPVPAGPRAALEAHAASRGIQIRFLEDQARSSDITLSPDQMRLDLTVGGQRWPDLSVGLVGRHQAANLALAVALCQAWAADQPEVSPEALTAAVRQGAAATRWPARFERISRSPEVFIDAAHTPAATAALAATVREALPGRRILLVFGASAGRAIQALVAPLAPLAAGVIATSAWHRGGEIQAVEEAFLACSPELPLARAANVEAAMATALRLAAAQGLPVLVTGSLFLAVEAAEVVAGRDPRALRFY